MSYCNAVINHSNCDFDTNCGLTCDQVYQRELSNLSPEEIANLGPNHYSEFMQMCVAYYFPDGCPDGSGGSSSSVGGGGGFELSPGAIDSLNVFFIDGFHGGILFSLPYLSGIFCVFLACFILISAGKNT